MVNTYTPPLGAVADLLRKHGGYELTNRCICGESPAGKDLEAHIAEVLEPVLAQVWSAGGDFVLTHPAMAAEYYRWANPYGTVSGNGLT